MLVVESRWRRFSGRPAIAANAQILSLERGCETSISDTSSVAHRLMIGAKFCETPENQTKSIA
jgi:hypothetical protein